MQNLTRPLVAPRSTTLSRYASRGLRAAATVVLLGAAALAGASEASAQVLRYGSRAPGNVVATGNTLGLSKETGINSPGARDSIGTFIALDPNAIDNAPISIGAAWPTGTTFDWRANGSAATLSIPNDAQVLYAELVWGGSYNYVDMISADLDTPVTLRFGADTLTVTPAAPTSITVDQEVIGTILYRYQYYQRSADVTAFVQAHGGGAYTTSGVPGTQNELINTLNAAGWSLVVAYRRDGDPIRNLTVFVGNDGKFVDEDTTVDYLVNGFCTPPTGEVEGTMVISTIEGDANLDGDQLLIAQTAAGPFVNLAGANNPADNFFCSQLNGPDGQLDTSGSFGMVNHDPFAATNVVGGRQGWDVTQVPLSSTDNQLTAGQTSAIIRATSTPNGDSYMPILVGLAIDVNAPKFSDDTSTVTTPVQSVTVGDTFKVTLRLRNEGRAPATNVRLTLPLQDGLDLATFVTDGNMGDVAGNAVDEAGMAAGVDMGTVGVAEERIVEIDVTVASMLAGNVDLDPVWSYEFETCAGQPAVSETYNPTFTPVTFVPGGATSSTSASTGSDMGSGSTGSAGTGGAGGGDDGGGVAFPQGGGCNCTTSGDDASTWHAGLALAGVAIVVARRRRRAA